MAVLIESMPMPSICDECPLKDEYAECAFLHKPVEYLGRLPDCPLREVSERKIDEYVAWLEHQIAWDNKKCIGGEQ